MAKTMPLVNNTKRGSEHSLQRSKHHLRDRNNHCSENCSTNGLTLSTTVILMSMSEMVKTPILARAELHKHWLKVVVVVGVGVGEYE